MPYTGQRPRQKIQARPAAVPSSEGRGRRHYLERGHESGSAGDAEAWVTIQKAEQIFGLSQKIIRMHAHDMKLPPFRGDSL